MNVKLLKFGKNVGLLIPAVTARKAGLLSGNFVRVIFLDREIRVRPVAVPRVDDYEYAPVEGDPDSEEPEERRGKW